MTQGAIRSLSNDAESRRDQALVIELASNCEWSWQSCCMLRARSFRPVRSQTWCYNVTA